MLVGGEACTVQLTQGSHMLLTHTQVSGCSGCMCSTAFCQCMWVWAWSGCMKSTAQRIYGSHTSLTHRQAIVMYVRAAPLVGPCTTAISVLTPTLCSISGDQAPDTCDHPGLHVTAGDNYPSIRPLNCPVECIALVGPCATKAGSHSLSLISPSPRLCMCR